METSRERIRKAIHHIQPEQVPTHIMGFDPIEPWLERYQAEDYVALRQTLGLDLQAIRAVYTGENAARGLNIWGQAAGPGGATGPGYSSVRGGYPLENATSVKEIERFPWPSAQDFDFQVVADELRRLPDTIAKWVKIQYALPAPGESRRHAARSDSPWIPLLCSLFDLFGMEATLVKMHEEPELIEAAIERITAFILEFEGGLLEATKGSVDHFYFGDDFATQSGMMLSPKDWRRFLKPSYARIYGLAKDYGLNVWIHCCGQFRPVMPDMIELGMDAWETVQVHLKGNEPEILKREYGKDLTFCGGISTQKTLPFGTPEQVRAEVRERIRLLGAGGGYVCAGDHSILRDVPMENVIAMLDEAQNFRF